jgi:hypothetical protein
MSNDVVISKELRDKGVKALERFKEECPSVAYLWTELIEALRNSPETVSLEGVERMKLHQWLNSQENGETELARVSDLRRLVAPVQPSAVVSRDAFRKVARDRYEKGMQSIDDTFPESCADAIFDSLQLPQSVAPVQGGGVELMKCPADLRDAVNNSDEFQWIVYDMDLMPEQITTKNQACGLRGAWEMYTRLKALRTTTQSAPSVGSVPSVEPEPSVRLLRKWAHNGEYTGLDKEAEAFATYIIDIPDAASRGFYVGWKLALLTSRTEGK